MHLAYDPSDHSFNLYLASYAPCFFSFSLLHSPFTLLSNFFLLLLSPLLLPPFNISTLLIYHHSLLLFSSFPYSSLTFPFLHFPVFSLLSLTLTINCFSYFSILFSHSSFYLSFLFFYSFLLFFLLPSG